MKSVLISFVFIWPPTFGKVLAIWVKVVDSYSGQDQSYQTTFSIFLSQLRPQCTFNSFSFLWKKNYWDNLQWDTKTTACCQTRWFLCLLFVYPAWLTDLLDCAKISTSGSWQKWMNFHTCYKGSLLALLI